MFCWGDLLRALEEDFHTASVFEFFRLARWVRSSSAHFFLSATFVSGLSSNSATILLLVSSQGTRDLTGHTESRSFSRRRSVSREAPSSSAAVAGVIGTAQSPMWSESTAATSCSGCLASSTSSNRGSRTITSSIAGPSSLQARLFLSLIRWKAGFAINKSEENPYGPDFRKRKEERKVKKCPIQQRRSSVIS